MSEQKFNSSEGGGEFKGKEKNYEIDAALWTVLWDLQNAVRRLILLNRLHGKYSIGSDEQWERLKKFLDNVLAHAKVRKRSKKYVKELHHGRRDDFYCDEEKEKFNKMDDITDEEIEGIDWDAFSARDDG